MTKIKIIDSIMGSGKTSYAIQKMNNDNENNYIYITPFLNEVHRIKLQCENKKFHEPLNFSNGKLDSLHNLLLKNKNIASTHALFRMATDVTRELISSNNYILILDEVMDVIEEVPLKKDDMRILTDTKLIQVQEDGLVLWNPEKLDYESQYDYIKTMCLNKNLFMVNNTLLMWTFPVDVFKSFKEVYILTYLFNGQIQRYYYDLYNIEYNYYSIVKENNLYSIQLNTCNGTKQNIKPKLHIINDSINKVGENEYALSVSWFKKPSNKPLLEQLQKNIYNYYRNKVNSKTKDTLWTTFKEYKSKLQGQRYTNGFIPVNSRATNDYGDRHNLAYCANIFLNPIIKQFFIDRGINVAENTYALSEMLQWIWRSAIRNNEEINLYIPSSRMRNLLLEWLDN